MKFAIVNSKRYPRIVSLDELASCLLLASEKRKWFI
nr:MAG TPA: hypothetical protein [Bacteriophage sp.]